MINTFLRTVEAGTVHNQRQLTVHLIFRPFWIFLPVRSRNKETKKPRISGLQIKIMALLTMHMTNSEPALLL